MRPSSGSSTRSRRDEVWEMKRKRWMSKQRNGGYNGDAAANGAKRPPVAPLSLEAPRAAEPQGAPGSPLSRLVASGYPATDQRTATTHQPYGERPSSGGFSSAVAGQWNNNVQQGLQSRQAKLDPNNAGPHIPHGGQRVTQAPGGVASIDLSFGAGGGGGGAVPSRTPPRMPSGQQQQPAYGQQHPSYGQQQQQQQHASYGQQQAYGHQMQQQQPSYAGGHHGGGGGGMRAPSPGSGRGGSSAPWGNENNYTPTAASQRKRDACPFGQDSLAPAGPPVGSRRGQGGPGAQIGGGHYDAYAPAAGSRGVSSSRGSRGSSPHVGADRGAALQAGCGAGAGGPAAGSYMGGRGAYGRPPGGGSSLVLG
eukprot:TRINITY_DN2810_c2_g1_i1.p1 TRINITY_DN2810_c2_g1~~TRINITY_DN2810_c2_g1_i1.p1  ORF type:complete len:365 (+),score=72.70 TRINITY_DN2810_c2_g1_i1:117-1211(+)